jgi:peptide-methionine (S)-S-oxide reductase
MEGPFPEAYERAVLGMGCFWGAERMFWQAPGVWTTAAGYAGGDVADPTYREVCSGRTGHVEVVLAVFDPEKTSYEEMLRIFWEGPVADPRALPGAAGRSRGVPRHVPG